MAQSTGIKKKKCAVFISGTGRNLKSLIQFPKKKRFVHFNRINNFGQSKSKRIKIWKNF